MASQPPPFGYGPQGSQQPNIPAPPTVPPTAPPGYGPPPVPPVGYSGGPPTPPTPPKKNMTALWVALGAVAIAALVAGIIVVVGGGGSDDSSDTTRGTRAPRTTTTDDTTTEPGTTLATEPPTTLATEPPTTPSPTTVFTPPPGAIDLTHGVYLPLPEGWERTDEPGDEVVQISNSTGLRVDAQALQREPGEDPAAAMQEYIDLFDPDFAAAGYSPATLRGTLGDDSELRNIGLYYRLINPDYTGFDGAVYLLQRTDGLTIVLDYYADRNSESMGLPDDDYSALIDSILAAPPLDTPVEFAPFEPFRVTSVHPTLLLDSLIGFALPPGWVDASVPGAAITNNAVDETVVAVKVTGQADAEAAAAAVQADLAARYAGFTYAAPVEVAAWANLQRRDINIDAVADPAIDGRPRVGVITVFYDPASQNAVSYSRFWYSDVTADGSDPNQDATDFIFDTYTDSFNEIP